MHMYKFHSILSHVHVCVFITRVNIQNSSNMQSPLMLLFHNHTHLPPSLFTTGYLLFFELFELFCIIKINRVMKMICIQWENLSFQKKVSPDAAQWRMRPDLDFWVWVHSSTWLGTSAQRQPSANVCFGFAFKAKTVIRKKTLCVSKIHVLPNSIYSIPQKWWVVR